jgi:hypothetical protein
MGGHVPFVLCLFSPFSSLPYPMDTDRVMMRDECGWLVGYENNFRGQIGLD